MGLLHSYKEIYQVGDWLFSSCFIEYFPHSFAGVFDMLQSESDTLRFVSSWHSDAQTECDEDPDCVAIVKESLTTDLL